MQFYKLYYNPVTQRKELYLPEFSKPLFVDFNEIQQKFQQHQSYLIAKAVGVYKAKKKPIRVCDLTAGLGKDAYLLSLLGCQLELVERCEVIAELLQDGLKRIGLELKCYIGEAKAYLHLLQKNQDFPEVIYFDPIFPDKNKTALSQKNARMLKKMAGPSLDAETVLLLARQTAKNRVVVKRPLHGPAVSTDKPDIVFRGKSIRFDVYCRI